MTALGVLATLVLAQGPGFELPVRERVLDNGLRVLTVERRDVPRVFCSLWWRVGSVHERPGLTGLSHFFEHMMFMGTEIIGTTDPAKDAELNARIEGIMSGIRRIKLGRLEAARRGEEPDPAGEARFLELWAGYEAALEEQKAISVPEHLSKIYQSNGGTRLNATTSFDRTNFFVELPANKVELFMWLESDRFRAPVFRSFYPEREVVKEERRRRTDSTPTGLIEEGAWALFWQAHPYSWPVIGWMSDIDQYTLSDAESYFRTHYSPENATAIFVGDLDPEEIESLAAKYFGRIPPSPVKPDPIVTQEPPQDAVRRMDGVADANASFEVNWHGPSGVHRDSPLLDLLMETLGGRSGRLYRPLVEEKKLALNIEASYWSLRHGGMIHLGVELREGAAFDQVEAAVEAAVATVREKGVTDREFQKARNQQLAGLVRSLKTPQGIASHLGYFETIGTWRDFPEYVRRLEAATPEDLQRCARTYLPPSGRTILTIRRKEAP